MELCKVFTGKALRCMGLSLVLATLSAGCADTDTALRDVFTFGGHSRSAYYIVPETYSGETAVPLVIVLHGKNQAVSDLRFATGMDDIAEREGFILAYPEAYEGAWNDGRMAVEQPSFIEGVDDVAFISEVAARLIANYNIDTARLYVCGFSNGALMTQRMAFQSADVFAAFGCVASAIPIDLPANITPAAPVNICMMHGTEDEIIPWEGGTPYPNEGTILSVPGSVGYWAAHNGCTDDPATRELPNRENNDQTQVTEYTYGPCDGGAVVVFYAIEGGGHTWPGAPASQGLFSQGAISRDLDAGETLWAFFEGKRRAAG